MQSLTFWMSVAMLVLPNMSAGFPKVSYRFNCAENSKKERLSTSDPEKRIEVISVISVTVTSRGQDYIVFWKIYLRKLKKKTIFFLVLAGIQSFTCSNFLTATVNYEYF